MPANEDEVVLSFAESLLTKKESQRDQHRKRIREGGWTVNEWAAAYQFYLASGFLENEAKWLADERVDPNSELGQELANKRKMRCELYMEEYNLTWDAAKVQCARELRRWNRKRGNINDFIFSEALA